MMGCGFALLMLLIQSLVVWGAWNILIAWLGMNIIFGLEPFYLAFWQAALLGIIISILRAIFGRSSD